MKKHFEKYFSQSNTYFFNCLCQIYLTTTGDPNKKNVLWTPWIAVWFFDVLIPELPKHSFRDCWPSWLNATGLKKRNLIKTEERIFCSGICICKSGKVCSYFILLITQQKSCCLSIFRITFLRQVSSHKVAVSLETFQKNFRNVYISFSFSSPSYGGRKGYEDLCCQAASMFLYKFLKFCLQPGIRQISKFQPHFFRLERPNFLSLTSGFKFHYFAKIFTNFRKTLIRHSKREKGWFCFCGVTRLQWAVPEKIYYPTVDDRIFWNFFHLEILRNLKNVSVNPGFFLIIWSSVLENPWNLLYFLAEYRKIQDFSLKNLECYGNIEVF